MFCRILLNELDRLPGDSRTQIGFIAFDSVLYFYGLDPSFPQPKMFIISDLDGNCYSNDVLLCCQFYRKNDVGLRSIPLFARVCF